MDNNVISITGTQPSESIVPMLTNALKRVPTKSAKVLDPEAECIMSALTTIAKFFRGSAPVQASIVINPAASVIQSKEDAPVKVPQLLVQLECRDLTPSRMLVLRYVPVSRTRITLEIVYDTTQFVAQDIVQWTSLTDDWCISSHGPTLDAETHASFLASALRSAGLSESSSHTSPSH